MRFNRGKFNRAAFNTDHVFSSGPLSAGVANGVPEYIITGEERVTNGDIEAGAMTGWDVTVSGSGTIVASSNASYVYAGSYGCLITTDNATTFPNDYQYCYMEQDIDLSNVDALTFQYKLPTAVTAWVTRSLTIKINGANVFNDSTQKTNWTAGNIDVSGYTGTKTIMVLVACSNNSGSGSYNTICAIDNISAVTGDIPSETPNILTFILTESSGSANSPAIDTTLSFTMEEGIANDPELTHSVFINTDPLFELGFDSGSVEITVGETITGEDSGATGVVVSVTVATGSWGGGDAAGTIIISDQTDVFNADEELDGSISGEGIATTTGPAERITPRVFDVNVSKSIDEAFSTAVLHLFERYSNTPNVNYREIVVTMKDHTGTDQEVFYGFVPNQNIENLPGEVVTKVTAHNHAWYLANQFIPSADRHTVTWVPVLTEGYVRLLTPDEAVTNILGGADWNIETGVKPYVNVVTDWGSSTRPERGFSWDASTTKWQAIMEICDYLGYAFDVIWSPADNTQNGVFCDIDEIDTYMGVPAAVTLDVDDEIQYVLDIKKEKRGTEKYNRVRVKGKRNKRILNFVNGRYEFVDDGGWIVVDGGTGATATIESCTKTGGEWGNPDNYAYGYLIISYDRTGDFLDGNTIQDSIIEDWGAATMQGNSKIYELYDEYEYSIESTDVTAVDGDRAREKYFDLEEEWDSTALIEAKCQAYYDLFALDATPYTVTFRDRCDFRPWQKIKLTGWTDIPEEWMRIVQINYHQTGGGGVIVTCTLNNANYVMSQRKMRRSLANNDVEAIENIIKKYLKQIEPKVGDVLMVQGEGVTCMLESGEIIMIPRGPE